MAADDAAEARAMMEKTGGAVVLDRFGQPRRNPAAVVERDATRTLMACLKALGMYETGDNSKGGRPVNS